MRAEVCVVVRVVGWNVVIVVVDVVEDGQTSSDL